MSRVIDGLTGGNISVAQAYITDVTNQKNRAKGLGMIGEAFGLGFNIGPAVGGALSVLRLFSACVRGGDIIVHEFARGVLFPTRIVDR